MKVTLKHLEKAARAETRETVLDPAWALPSDAGDLLRGIARDITKDLTEPEVMSLAGSDPRIGQASGEGSPVDLARRNLFGHILEEVIDTAHKVALEEALIGPTDPEKEAGT